LSFFLRKSEKAQREIMKMWKGNETTISLYSEGMSCLPETVHSIVFGSLFLKYLSDNKLADMLAKHKVNKYL
jgi:hypothetical protein